MNTIIGFAAMMGQDEAAAGRGAAALDRALRHFPHLNRVKVSVGESSFEVWGHGDLHSRLWRTSDGGLLLLVGSPVGPVDWRGIEGDLAQPAALQRFDPPWDGRFNLLRIDPDGRKWTLWNDWVGSIPVFYSQVKSGWVASTLEPIVVAQAGFTANDFHLPGLVSLLIHGNFLGQSTLFEGMKTLPADCAAEISDRDVTWRRRFTVVPTQDRWETGWADLVDEAYHLSHDAIASVLRLEPRWILPLSGGLDSRLIAAVGAKMGVDLRAFTWGKPNTTDGVYAGQVAKTLGIPWRLIDPGSDYLVDERPLWSDLFGSAMHFHGMYQIPFFRALATEPDNPILSGFLGECTAGYDVRFNVELRSTQAHRYQSVPDGFLHWLPTEVESLLKAPCGEALDAVADAVQAPTDAVQGPWFQRLRFQIFWGRQRLFTRFQSTLGDYWRGAATPYLNREYARFSFSLPRVALDDRRLQVDVLRKYYFDVARAPVGFWREPFILSGKYLLQKRLASSLPNALRRGPLQQFNTTALLTDIECVRKHGWQAFWPIRETWSALDALLDTQKLAAEFERALSGDKRAVRRLQSVQTIAYRLPQ